MSEFYAIKLSHNTFDIFEGKQHHPDFWSRLRGGRNGVYVQAGKALPHGLVRALAASIDPRQEKQLVQVDN